MFKCNYEQISSQMCPKRLIHIINAKKSAQTDALIEICRFIHLSDVGLIDLLS